MPFQITVLGAILVSGIVAGLTHCLGMCGPLVFMVGTRFPKASVPGMTGSFLIYHAGRVAVYAVLGFLVGWIGSLIGLGNGFFYFSAWISLLFGMAIVLLGMGYVKVLALETAVAGGGLVTRGYGRFLKTGGSSALFPLGVLNGLLPCGLVYSSLLLAVSTGSPYWGALDMLVFGLATTPSLLVFGIGLRKIGLRYRPFFSRFANLMIVIVGAQLVLRGLAGLGLISHAQVAGLVLW